MESHESGERDAGDTRVVVFCAGSLTGPFDAVKAAFEAEHPGINVTIEPGGSVSIIRAVTEEGKSADVVAPADYALIPDMMMPDHADWCVTFAKNQMVLTYTGESRYADEITAGNWYEILARDGVRWGLSDPKSDPAGYRALMVIRLACGYYGRDRIFEDLIGAHSTITVTGENGISTVHAADARSDDAALFIRPKADELITMLLSGDLDYAWEYRSVAVQSGLHFIELPEEIDLSSVEFAGNYATVQVEAGKGAGTTLHAGAPIVYGVTVPKTAEHPALGLTFVAMLIGDAGRGIFERAGQPPIVPVGGYGDVPAVLEPLVVPDDLTRASPSPRG